MKNIIDSKKEYGIIMEDDVIFKDNFINNFNDLTKISPETFDIIYMGTFPFYEYYKKYSNCENPIFKSNNSIGNLCNMDNITVFPWTGNNKGTDFYIISKKACIKFILYIEELKKYNKKISTPIDHFMGVFFYNNGNVFWGNKEITLHGSISHYTYNGIFKNSMVNRGH
jgi:GR25 family glycosyltransferase involved in LPS biosynthesis